VPFKPEFAGKMNFYLSAVDDGCVIPPISFHRALIPLQGANRLVVEYALRDTTKTGWCCHLRILPRRLKGELPTATEIKRGLGRS